MPFEHRPFGWRLERRRWLWLLLLFLLLGHLLLAALVLLAGLLLAGLVLAGLVLVGLVRLLKARHFFEGAVKSLQ